MREKQLKETSEPAEVELVDLDDFAGYEDGESYVICDKTNAKAWIRADVTRAISR